MHCGHFSDDTLTNQMLVCNVDVYSITAEHVDSWSTWSLQECLGKQGFWCGNLPFFFLPFWGTHFFHLTQPMHYQIFLVFLGDGGGGGGGHCCLGSNCLGGGGTVVWGVGVLIPSDTMSQVSREYNIVITQ